MQLSPIAAAATHTPADFERIARTLDRVFTGSYGDQWENKALPAVLRSGRSADEIEAIGGAVAGSFRSDEQAYSALVTSVAAQGSAAAIGAAIRGVDEVFDGSYGDAWEVKSLPTVYGSRHLDDAPVLLRAIAQAFASDEQAHAALETTFTSARPAADSAVFVRDTDSAFAGSYGDAWENKALRRGIGDARSGAELGGIVQAMGRTLASDEARYQGYELALGTSRTAGETAAIMGALDTLFDGSYGDQWELKAARVALPSRLAADQVTGAARAAQSMAGTDQARFSALETLLQHA